MKNSFSKNPPHIVLWNTIDALKIGTTRAVSKYLNPRFNEIISPSAKIMMKRKVKIGNMYDALPLCVPWLVRLLISIIEHLTHREVSPEKQPEIHG